MNNNSSITVDIVKSEPGFLKDLLVLIKFRLTAMVVFTSVIAYLLVAGLSASFTGVILLIVGGFFVVGAANALNQALEKDFDKLMIRTANRPIAAGRMTMSNGIMIGGLMSLVGITVLALFNPLTAFLGMLSLLCYAFVYTPLKRHSTVAVLVGAIPGAMPMLIGAVAFDGYISSLALVLFLIQFLWQFPHFWAIGFLSFNEYEKAGYHFIPKKLGAISNSVMWQSILATLALIPISLLLSSLLGMQNWSIVLLMITGICFCLMSVQFYVRKNRRAALALMFGSILYLPVFLGILLIDQF